MMSQSLSYERDATPRSGTPPQWQIQCWLAGNILLLLTVIGGIGFLTVRQIKPREPWPTAAPAAQPILTSKTSERVEFDQQTVIDTITHLKEAQGNFIEVSKFDKRLEEIQSNYEQDHEGLKSSLKQLDDYRNTLVECQRKMEAFKTEAEANKNALAAAEKKEAEKEAEARSQVKRMFDSQIPACDVVVVGVNSNNLAIDPKYLREIKAAFAGRREWAPYSSKYRVGLAMYTQSQLDKSIELSSPQKLPDQFSTPGHEAKNAAENPAQLLQQVVDKFWPPQPGANPSPAQLPRRRVIVIASTKCPVPTRLGGLGVDALLVGTSPPDEKLADEWRQFCAAQQGLCVIAKLTESTEQNSELFECRLRQLLHPLVATLHTEP